MENNKMYIKRNLVDTIDKLEQEIAIDKHLISNLKTIRLVFAVPLILIILVQGVHMLGTYELPVSILTLMAYFFEGVIASLGVYGISVVTKKTKALKEHLNEKISEQQKLKDKEKELTSTIELEEFLEYEKNNSHEEDIQLPEYSNTVKLNPISDEIFASNKAKIKVKEIGK